MVQCLHSFVNVAFGMNLQETRPVLSPTDVAKFGLSCTEPEAWSTSNESRRHFSVFRPRGVLRPEN